MVNAIDVARDALSLTGKEVEQGYWQNRNVTHWSTHVCMTGAFIGGMALIAGIAIDSTIIAALGSLLLVTNGLSAYYLKKFSVFSAIDDIIRALADTVRELYNQIVGLHTQIGAIGPARELITEERLKIETRLKESQATIDRLQKVEKDYEAVSKKIVQITGVYQPLKSAVDEFIKNVSELPKGNLDFERLSVAMKGLADERTRFDDNVKTLGDETKELNTHEKRVGDQISKLNTIINAWNSRYTELVGQNERLAKQVVELQRQIATFSSENQKAESLITRIEALRDKIPDDSTLRAMIEEIKSKA